MRLGVLFLTSFIARLHRRAHFSLFSTLNNMQVKKLTEFAVIPTRGSIDAAGLFINRVIDKHAPISISFFLFYRA